MTGTDAWHHLGDLLTHPVRLSIAAALAAWRTPSSLWCDSLEISDPMLSGV